MGNFFQVPPIPKEYRDQLRGVSSAVEKWMDHVRNLLNNGMFPWTNVSKAGSALSDIETRPHSQLQSVLGGTDHHHVQQTERAELTALDALAAGMVAKTANATYAARTITGTTGKITVTNGDGVAGNPTATLPATITGPQRFGGETAYAEFEADGTLVFAGAATVFDDLNFDPDSSGGPAATLPDYVTINNVVHREFTSLNNQVCGSGEELPHGYKLSTTLYPHAHIFLKAGESAGTTGVTFALYWELRTSAATTSGSVSLAATSAQLASNGHKINIYDNTGFAGSAEKGAHLSLSIARTAGDAGDVIVTTYGVHYEIDTVGSRSVAAK